MSDWAHKEYSVRIRRHKFSLTDEWNPAQEEFIALLNLRTDAAQLFSRERIIYLIMTDKEKF